MILVHKLLPQGCGLAAAVVARAPAVWLDWDVRQKSRFEAVDSAGRRLGVFLPRGSVVRDGDVLVAEDGSLVRVRSAAQAVMVVRPHPVTGTPFDLVRAAYHLGNRHVQIELRPDHLKIEPDHVLAAMLQQMRLVVESSREAFEPEGGAYHGGHAHGDAHGHAHGHAHDRAHDRAHAPGHDHDHGQGAS